MVCKTTLSTDPNSRRQRSGFTIVELLVSTGIAAVVTTALMLTASYAGRSFQMLMNYSNLNKESTLALDYFVKDVRETTELLTHTTNTLVFSKGTGLPTLTYTYSPAQRTLTRNLGNDTKVVLTGCDSLKFSIYQRTPVSGTYDQYPAATNTNCKVVQVDWKCSRSILSGKLNTQEAQTAKIVMRNKNI